MRLRRLPVGLALPAMLVGLVCLLATLQYQWLGKVSEAERRQAKHDIRSVEDVVIAEVGAWAGPLQSVKTEPDRSGVTVTLHFEGAVIAFVAPSGEG